MKPDDSVLTNEHGEIEREYDRYFSKIAKCKNEDEVTVEWSRHEVRKEEIKEKYSKHKREIKDRGIEL